LERIVVRGRGQSESPLKTQRRVKKKKAVYVGGLNGKGQP